MQREYFRSRLAEAYLNSKQIPNLKAISSGIEAEINNCGSITWYAQRLIQDNNLIPFEKPVWEQTTKILLETGDLTIFMHQNIYDYAVKHFGFEGGNYQTWEIPDIRVHLLTFAQEVQKIEATEKIYAEIKQKIDELIKEI